MFAKAEHKKTTTKLGNSFSASGSPSPGTKAPQSCPPPPPPTQPPPWCQRETRRQRCHRRTIKKPKGCELSPKSQPSPEKTSTARTLQGHCSPRSSPRALGPPQWAQRDLEHSHRHSIGRQPITGCRPTTAHYSPQQPSGWRTARLWHTARLTARLHDNSNVHRLGEGNAAGTYFLWLSMPYHSGSG